MSAPAAKTFSPPYTTTARTASSADTEAAAARSSSWIRAFNAFIGGRSSRIVAIPSSTATVTNSPTSDLPYLVPEREQRHRYQLDVRQAQRDPDNAHELRDGGGEVAERQPPTGHDQPDHVADGRGDPGGRPLYQLPPERPQRVVGHPERGDAERDRHDQDAADQPRQRVPQRQQQPTEDQPEDVQHKAHGFNHAGRWRHTTRRSLSGPAARWRHPAAGPPPHRPRWPSAPR